MSDTEYRNLARNKALKYGIDPDIFEKQIETESGFDPNAYNPSGASGIAQIIERYHPDVDVWDVDASLDYAAKWMSELQRQFGSIKDALIAYNWGPGNLRKWDGRTKTLPEETRRYLTKILGDDQYDPTKAAFTGDYAFPVVGYVDYINTHWSTGERGATDIFAPRGTPIIACRGGKVTYAGYDDLGGNNVLIQGDDGLTYYYAHLDEWPSVASGATVKTGQYLGPLGDSGNAKAAGPHLHFGAGYGIINGSGPQGGAGRDFDAIGLLNAIRDGNVGENEVEDMAKVAELEMLLAQSEAELAESQKQLAAANSWIGSAINDTLIPSVEQLNGLGTDDTKAEILDDVGAVSGNLQYLIDAAP